MTSPPIVINLGHSSLWTPYKELFAAIQSAIGKKEPDSVPELDTLLRAHKPSFLSLLNNPIKNPNDRAALQRAPTSGISVVGQTTPQVLPQNIVDEALVISDMFELNEIAAVELLIVGQHQQPLFPGLTRGLVSVLLYYDGRRNLANTLRLLMQARDGRTWTLGLNQDLLFTVTHYTQQLQDEGISHKVLDLLEKINPVEEVNALQKNRALGSPRYRKQVVDLIDEIRQSLAESLFCLACQSTVSFADFKQLMDYLAKHSTLKGDGTLDSVAVSILMALLYTIDVSVLQTSEEMDKQVRRCPLIQFPQLIKSFHKEIMSENSWEVPGVISVIRLFWSISLRTLLQYSWAIQGVDVSDVLEMDEKVLESALSNNCFQNLNNLILKSGALEKEEFYVKRVHSLITDLISLMPLKIKELRNQGDESARIVQAHLHEGIQPPTNLNRHFEHLIGAITTLYKNDNFHLELAFDFWCPNDNQNDPTFIGRPNPRQISLYKFLRLAGDILPAPLFVPYIAMLTALSQLRPCAHQCYIMLKLNGRNSGSQSSIVSWDHFFDSLYQYYNNLKQEAPSITTDTQPTYHQRLHHRGISPQEVDGLKAILKLLETVAKHDEMARIALWENPQYVPGVVLIGLVGCSVPPEIKASLLSVLAAFVQSPEIANSVWLQLEYTQIIPTVKTLSKYQPNGILMDLIEVEIRLEEYPITQAALLLIESLLNHPLPIAIGAGQRKPGFEPYLEYIKDTVFLQLQNRAYKNEGDKWQLSLSCVKIMLKLLKEYEMSQADFIGHIIELPGGINVPASQPPGFILMVQLLQDSPLLHLILLLLDEGTRVFDIYAPPSWIDQVQECTLACLQLIHQTLIRQDEFLSYMRNSGSSLLVTSMDRLLLGVNPRSGQPDHMVVIAKYVTYNVFLPKHALEATVNLEILCKISQIAQQLVLAFTSSPENFEILLHGFVECLDTEVVEEHEKNELDNETRVKSDLRQHIMQLLLTCLNHPSPNLSHLLLGFQTRKPVSQTLLQDPGVLNSPRTCLHSVLALLDQGLEIKCLPIALQMTPRLAEMSYHLLYVLCSNKDTSEPTLRYLRTNREFIYQHIQFIPFQLKAETNQALIFGQQSWLLKTLALELRMLAIHQQRSHIQRLLKLLLEDSPENRDPPEHESMDSTLRSNFMMQSTAEPSSSVRRKLLQMLDSMIFTHKWPTPPSFEYLDSSKVQKALQQCESDDQESGQKMINVYQFHQCLVEDLPAFQGLPALSHRPPFTSEVRSALQYALQRNNTRQDIQNKQQAFDAWRQVTEVIFSACPLDILQGQISQVILQVCLELLSKVLEDGALQGLTAPASGVILILISNLHDNLIKNEPHSLPASVSSSLATVLKSVLEALVKTGMGLQRIRVNYYGALLNLLRIVQKWSDNKKLNLRVLDQETEIDKLSKEYISVIMSFGDSLMDLLCRDACGGHDVTKMSALAVLDTIICLDRVQHWFSFLESKGYLRHIICSLSNDDLELQKLLIKGPETMKALYVFDSKLSLLIRVACNVNGAQALLRCGVITKLCECEAINMRPEKDYSTGTRNETAHEEAHSQRVRCFQQILKPVFQLVLAVVTSLGEHHHEASTQLLYFVTTHGEVFNQILRDRSVMADVTVAEELELATALLARLFKDLPSPGVEGAMLEKQGQIGLLQMRAMAVLQTISSTVISQPRLHGDGNNSREELTLKLTLMQVVANVLSSCRSEVSRTFSASSSFMSKVLFTPTLVDTRGEDLYMSENNFQQRGIRSPNLGFLVNLLQNCCNQVHSAVNRKKKISSSLSSVNTLWVGELNDWMPSNNSEDQKSDLTMQQIREQAKLNMSELLQIRSKEIALHCFIIECVLLLLWRHLEYFLKFCVPDELDNSHQELGHFARDYATRSAQIKITKQDLDALRSDMKAIINDQVFNRVQSVQEYLSGDNVNVEFSEALLRRIKRLVKINN